MPQDELTLSEGPGGWVQAELREAGQLKGRWWVHLARKRSRWEADAQFSLGPFAATARIPVRRIVLAVNANAALGDALLARLSEPVSQLGSLDFLKPFSGFPHPERFVLKRPPGHRLDDSFYADVARAYRDAVARGMNPRSTIAADAGVSTDVAGRWIWEARKKERGFLPPTTSGKVKV